jgi:hypothetical protein
MLPEQSHTYIVDAKGLPLYVILDTQLSCFAEVHLVRPRVTSMCIPILPASHTQVRRAGISCSVHDWVKMFTDHTDTRRDWISVALQKLAHHAYTRHVHTHIQTQTMNHPPPPSHTHSPLQPRYTHTHTYTRSAQLWFQTDLIEASQFSVVMGSERLVRTCRPCDERLAGGQL